MNTTVISRVSLHILSISLIEVEAIDLDLVFNDISFESKMLCAFLNKIDSFQTLSHKTILCILIETVNEFHKVIFDQWEALLYSLFQCLKRVLDKMLLRILCS